MSTKFPRIGIRRAMIRHLALGALVASGLTFGVASVAGALTAPASNAVTNNAVTALGGSIIFTATVTGSGGVAPTGTVVFTVTGTAGATACSTSSATLAPSSGSAATATCTITAATAGSYVVSDAYPGDGTYSALSSATNTDTVVQATPTNIVTNNSVTALGGSIVFTATLTGPTNGATPSGTVVFTVSGTAGATACTSSVATLAGSANVATASCTITASAAGTYIVGDAYPGDTNYVTVTSATNTVTVAKATPTNVVTNNGVTALGGSVVFTATVTGSGGVVPTGTVAFTVTGTAGVTACSSSSATLTASTGSAATATCTITESAAGTYIVGDAYPGNGSYLTVTSATNTATVAKATPTNVVTNNGVTTVGGSIVFTTTVTGPIGGATPSGTVAFTVTGTGGVTACTSSSATLAGSANVATATCTITAATAGTYIVSDVYPGDGNYLTVTSATDTATASVSSGGGGGTPPATTNAPPPSGIATTSYGTPVSGSVTSGAPLTVTSTSGSISDAVVVPTGALPTGTVVSVYPITTTSALLALIPSGQTYVTSIAVSWESAGSTPAATAPITLTISDASIAVGDTIFQLSATGTLTSVGTATAAGTVTVTFSGDPVFVVTSATPLVTPPPVVSPHATKVVGRAASGRTVSITILGVGFYGQPKIVSSTGRATNARVAHDSGTQLTVRVSVKAGTARGVHTFKITLANGKSFNIHYSQS